MKNLVKSGNYIIACFFAFCLSLAVAGCALSKNSAFSNPKIAVAFGTAAAFAVAYMLSRMETDNFSLTKENVSQMSIVLCMAIFVSQISVTLLAEFTPKNDLYYVSQGAKNLILGKDLYDGIPKFHNDYFACYPNNNMLFCVLYFLYKIEYRLTGGMSDFLPTLLNMLCLSFSYLLMCRCAVLIHTPQRAMTVAVKGLLFTPFYTYTNFFYTDSIAMPLVMGAAYTYLLYRQKKNIALLAGCGGLLAAAFKLKGTAIVFLAAIVLDLFVKRDKLKVYIMLLAPFFAVCKAVSAFSMHLLGITKAELESRSFPFIHWIMMSADGNGGYNKADFLYTQSFSGSSEKFSADLARLLDKLQSQGFIGFVEHLFRKISYTWANFTFMAGYYHKSAFSSSFFLVIAFLCHFTLLFSIFMRFWQSRRDGNTVTFVFKLSFFGLAVFLLIWETKCRYLVSLFPLFLLI